MFDNVSLSKDSDSESNYYSKNMTIAYNNPQLCKSLVTLKDKSDTRSDFGGDRYESFK